MNAQIVIRRERPDQPDVAEALAALDRYLHSLYPPEANHILDLHALMSRDVQFYAARDRAGALIGTGAIRVMPGEPDSEGVAYGEVKRMYVDPCWRGRGIGARLLAHLEVQMLAARLPWAMLETGADQTEAVRLYERAGYRRRGAFGGYPDNGLSLFLSKPLA